MITKSSKRSHLCNLLPSVIAGTFIAMMLPFNIMANSLDALEFSELPDGGVQLKLTLSDSAITPTGFTIDQPPRLILDFPDVVNGLPKQKIQMGLDLAKSAIALEDSQRTRIVINLNDTANWTAKTLDRSTYITLSSNNHLTRQPQQATDRSSSAHKVTNIDFNRGAQGEARVTIGLSSDKVAVDSREEPGAIVVEFLATSVPPQLANRLNVIDFGTPVSLVETHQTNGMVRMVITAAGDYNVLAYQTASNYTIEVQPLVSLSSAEVARRKKSYNGERLSLNFQNIEVRSVLQLLADFTGKNLVASDTVTGNVTLRLKNVPWDQALDIILSTKGLSKREDGNVMWVAPSEEIAARERLELESQQQLQELAPLYTEYVGINFARAAELADLISADENNLLTERGSISIDERTNTLILHDTEEKIADVRQLISTLDVAVQQVLIESRIVNASTDFSKNLGVRFGAFKSGGTSSPRATTGNLNATTQALNGDDLEFDDRLNVNMPAGGLGGISASSIAFAISKADQLLELELSALEAEGKGEILSNPRVVTSNQREAVISQGTQIAYQEASSSGATSTSFQDAVLSLTVTPQITPDDHIIMDLAVSKDAVGALVGGVPTIDTQNINTQVLVDNGDTIVIGGIYEQTKTRSATRTPFLSDLPYVGFLFRTTSQTNDKSELLIFVTPKILRDGLAAAL